MTDGLHLSDDYQSQSWSSHPYSTSTSSSSDYYDDDLPPHQQMYDDDDSLSTMKAMVVLWALLLALYLYDERKSRALAQEQRWREEGARRAEELKKRLDPERRRVVIGERIESREILTSSEAKSLIATIDTQRETSTVHPASSTSLPNKTSTTSTDTEPMCSVCLEGFAPGDRLSWAKLDPNCRHVFHTDCLVPWLMEHDECPYCRTVLIEYEDEEGEGDDVVAEGDSIASTTREEGGVELSDATTAVGEERWSNPFRNTVVAKLERLFHRSMGSWHLAQVDDSEGRIEAGIVWRMVWRES